MEQAAKSLLSARISFIGRAQRRHRRSIVEVSPTIITCDEKNFMRCKSNGLPHHVIYSR